MKNNIISGKNGLLRLTLLVLSLVCYVSVLKSQAVASLESDELLMGKTMKLTLSVPLPNDTSKVEFPLLHQAIVNKSKYIPLLNDSVEILTSYTMSMDQQNGKDWMKYNMTVQAFDSGRYELPPFEFIVDGQKVNSNKVALTVIPVKAKKDDPIEPFNNIVEPFEINPNPEEMEEPHGILWWLIPSALILLGLIGYLYYRFKKTGSLRILSKPLPPYAVALNKLKKLQAQNLPQKGKTKEYYTRLTDILRSYLNRQFKIKTFEKTSNEILMQVKDNEHLCGFEEILRSIFETSDFVKFAKVQPSVIENSRCLTDAEKFIEASHPTIEEAGKKNKGGVK